MTGFVIFAHGSSIESANAAVRAVAAATAELAGFVLYETAFLDGGRPLLPEAVESLVKRGASDIVIVPYFLTLGLHLQRDLPALVKDLESKSPRVPIRVTAPLDGHPGLSAILADRAREALSA